MATALKNVVSIKSIAGEAIDLQRKLNTLEGQLDPLKGSLRDYARGETETIIVPGKGQVSVSKPGTASAKPELVGDYDLFMALPEEDRKIILSMGVIRVETKTRAASAAKVSIKPNV